MDDFGNAGISISAVILDLDGTILNTEQATKDILKEFLERYGKVLNKEKEAKRLGMTQKEAAAAIVVDYDLSLTPDQFTKEIMPMYRNKWPEAKALPGADRLIKHLHKNGVPLALASNSLRTNIYSKISHQQGWIELFSVILGSDQVKSGKPSPDIFLEAAKQMGVDAVQCLVIEDSLVGVKAAKAAGMKVVAVPSLQNEADKYSFADSVLHSILEFQPEQWGLLPFQDWVNEALPLDAISFEGLYSDGFINEFPDNQLFAFPDQVFGVYFGWAKFDTCKVFKVVISIGWDHGFCSSKRKIQAVVLDESNDHICHKQMQALLVGYIRGLCSTAFDHIEINEEDKLIARACLDLPAFAHPACRVFFKPVALEDDSASSSDNELTM